MNKIEEKLLNIIQNEADCYREKDYKVFIGRECMKDVIKESFNVTKETSIGFAEFIRKTYFVGENEWVENWVDKRENSKTTEELFEIYLKTLE